jgi:hypothetical protein
MRKIFTVISCALVLSASQAQGAEYFIYKNTAGNVVLSNITPPPRAEVIQRHDLQDVSDEAVRASLERELSLSRRLMDEQLAESNQKLAESNHRLAQAIDTASARREWDPGLVVTTSELPLFDGLHRTGRRIDLRPHSDVGRFRQRGHLQRDFHRHSKFR